MEKQLLFFICFFSLGLIKVNGQESRNNLLLDSLSKKSEEYLIKKFYENETDSIKAYPYANAYLLKSKEHNDSIKIATGFYFLSTISINEIKLSFSDSILTYTQNKQNRLFPAIAYITKANYYYKNKNFYKALQNYLEARRAVDINENTGLNYYIKNRIALLKSRYGEDDEALRLFKEVYAYYVEQGYFNKSENHYFPIVFALSDSYLRNEEIDSAVFYAEKGYRDSKNNPLYRNYFIFQQGIIEHEKGNFPASINSLEETLPILKEEKDLSNIAYANYFIGDSYLKQNNTEKAIPHFKKVDSIYQIIKDIHPDLRKAYVHLIEYYKLKEDKDQQLIYITKLLEVDSMLTANYKTINKKFTDEYDTPRLIAEKDKLIGELENNITSFSNWLSILLFVLLLIIVITIVLYFKRKKDVQRFKKLLEDSKTKEQNILEEQLLEEINKKNTKLPDDLTKLILENLLEFESKKGFLKKKLKVYDLAKQFNTNTKYLSMVINEHKNKNFSQYLNDLRIEYAIHRLREEKKFRKYTIKAISEEIGFSNTESFSKAFYKRTKIYPSFFITQLEISEE